MALSEEEKKANRKISSDRYYAENKEKIAAKTAESMAANPERQEARRLYLKTYAKTNKEKADARSKKWRNDNRERDLENKRRYQKENPEKGAAAGKKYYEANKEKVLKASRRSLLKNKYGLTQQQYEEMLESQDGRCAICKKDNLNNKKALSVDHDHDSGRIRGLLCELCNWGIGSLKDSIENLHSAISYLELHNRTQNLELK